MLHIPRMTTVYAYSRFSTPEQAAGDSLRRQTDAARRWADARGFKLDERLSLTDEGVSSYRGSNTAEDRGLGGFLFACREGLIPSGSYLLVESLDRISRMPPRRAQRILDDIVDAGVTIVTLNDGQEYTADRLDNDPMALLISLLVSWRAHEESATKGRRVAAAWAAKRDRMRSGEDRKLTRKAPAWMRWDVTAGEWQFHPIHSETVRRIYRLTVEGWGEHRIAELFNGEAVPVMGVGRMWHRSTVAKVLRNPSVIGRLIPGRIEHVDGKRARVFEEPIEGAYPPVIDEALWLTVRALKDGTSTTPRGRHAGVSHILAGLARCPVCGAAMTRVSKGSRAKAGKPKLVCTRAKAGAGCAYVSVALDEVESAFQDDWQRLGIDIPAGGTSSSLDRDISDVQGAQAAKIGHLEELLTIVERSPSAALAGRIRALEEEVRTLSSVLVELDERRAAADHGLIQARLDGLHDLMSADEGVDIPAVNRALRTLFCGVVVDHRQGRLRFCWRQGGETALVYRWTV